MAAQTCTWDNVGGDSNWHNAANWATTVEADRVPLTGDSVVFNNTVNDNCLLTSNSAANMTDLTMTGYTGVLAMATNNLDFDGVVVLDGMITASAGAVLYCGGDFTKTTSMFALPAGLTVELNGTGNVACNLVTGGRLIINTAGTHTLVTDSYWNNFTLTLGTIVGTGYIMKVNGDVLYTAGTATDLIIQFTGDGNLSWNTSSNPLQELIVDNTKTCTLTGNAQTQKVSGAGDIAPSASQNLYFVNAVDDFWSLAGTNTATVFYINDTLTSRTSGLAITAKRIEWREGVVILDADVTATAPCDIGNSSDNMSLDLNGHEISTDSSFDIKSGATGTLGIDLNGGTIDAAGAVNLTGITITDTATGGIIECAGDFTIDSALPDGVSVVLNGTGDITTVSGNRSDLTVDTAGTHTAIGVGYWDSFLLTTGTYADGGLAHNIAGSIIRTAGTLTSTGLWSMTASGTLKNEAQRLSLSVGSGVEATLSLRVLLRDLAGDGTITGDNTTNFILFNTSGIDNFWTFSGTVTSKLEIVLGTGTTRSLDQGVTLGNRDLLVKRGTLQLGGDVNLGAGNLRAFTDVGDGDIDMVTLDLTCIDVRIGNGPRNAGVDFGTGTHAITGDIKALTGATGVLTVDVGTAVFNLTPAAIFNGGVVGGTSNPLTMAGAAINGGHAEIHGGTVVDVSMPLDDAALDCTDDVVDGGGNDNCWFSGVGGVYSPTGCGSASSDRVVLGFVVDTHNGAAADADNRFYSEATAKAQLAVDEFVARDLDYIIHLGDAINVGTDGDPGSYMDNLVTQVNGNSGSIPALWCTGNHDIDDAFSKAEWLTANSQAAPYTITDIGNLRIFTLDPCFSDLTTDWPTNKDYTDAYVSTAQLNSLGTDLTAADAAGKFSVICCHYGLGIYSSTHDATNAGDVRAILNVHKVIMVISGHHHATQEVSVALGSNLDGVPVKHVGLEANVEGQIANGDAAFTIVEINDSTGVIQAVRTYWDAAPD